MIDTHKVLELLTHKHSPKTLHMHTCHGHDSKCCICSDVGNNYRRSIAVWSAICLSHRKQERTFVCCRTHCLTASLVIWFESVRPIMRLLASHNPPRNNDARSCWLLVDERCRLFGVQVYLITFRMVGHGFAFAIGLPPGAHAWGKKARSA